MAAGRSHAKIRSALEKTLLLTAWVSRPRVSAVHRYVPWMPGSAPLAPQQNGHAGPLAPGQPERVVVLLDEVARHMGMAGTPDLAEPM